MILLLWIHSGGHVDLINVDLDTLSTLLFHDRFHS